MDGPVPVREPAQIRTYRYSLPNVKGQGWVIAFLDSTGCFTALSDWGDVAYRWSTAGLPESTDFRRFLLQCDVGYLTSKLGQNRREYDSEGTLKAVKEAIAKWGETDPVAADAERGWLDAYNSLTTEMDLAEWHQVTDLGDISELYCTRYVSEVTAFMEHAWPRLREAIEAELVAEETGKRT